MLTPRNIDESSDGLVQTSKRRAVWVIGLRGGGAGLQLAVQALIGWKIGAAGLGLFLLYVSWGRLSEIVFGLGFKQYVLRTIAWRRGESAIDSNVDAQANERLVVKAIEAILAIGMTVTGLTLAVGLVWYGLFWAIPERAWLVPLALLTAAAMAGLRVVVDAYKAEGRANTAMIVEFHLQPAALLVVAVVSGLILSDHQGLLPTLVCADVVIVWLLMLASLWRWRRKQLKTMARGNPAARSGTARRRTAWQVCRGLLTQTPGKRGIEAFAWPWRTIFVYAGFNLVGVLIWTLPYLVLPWFADDAAIGRFGAAQRLVAVAGMILTGLISLFAPRFAEEYARRDTRSLRNSLLRSQAYAVVAYLPLLAVFVFLPGLTLSLFGPEFAQARTLLWIMAGGQLLAVGGGLAPDFLNMTGAERLGLTLSVFILGLMVGLYFTLGLFLGVVGVAGAYAIGAALRRLVPYGFCWLGLARMGSSSGQGPGA